MRSWPDVQLGEVCEAKTGTRDPGRKPEETFRYVDISSVDNGAKKIYETGIVYGRSAPSRARQVIKMNDVLVSMTRPNLNAVAIVPPELDGEICSTGFSVLRVKDVVLPKYLFHFVRSRRFIAATTSAVSGALYPAITASFLRSLSIPLPPLEEQRRIVWRLDRAVEIRRRADAARVNARAIIPAFFLDTFGDPATNPMGWPIGKLGNHADVQGGVQVSAKRATLPVELPYLRVANVMRGSLNLSEIKLIRVTAAEARRTTLVRGDVLVVEGHGNPNEIGRAAVWDGSIADCSHQNHLIRVRPQMNCLASDYVENFLNSNSGRSILIQSGKTTSGLNTISTRNVKEISIPLPPMDLQAAFAERVQRIETIGRRLDAAAAKAQAMAAGLSTEIFGQPPHKGNGHAGAQARQ